MADILQNLLSNKLLITAIVLLVFVLVGLAFMDKELRALSTDYLLVQKEVEFLKTENKLLRTYFQVDETDELQKAYEFQKTASSSGIPYLELDTAASQLNAAPIKPKKEV